MNEDRARTEGVDVSVLLITYNHARFVRSAVESVLNQKTSRKFELIISEDASTDGTREIVQDVAAGDPRIRAIYSPRNLRSNETVKRAIDASWGRYVCILDGDDRWLANDKIDRQAELLDHNPDVAGCFHNALIAYGDAREPTYQRWTLPTVGPRVSFSELWEGNPFATCAGMLRASPLRNIGSWYVGCFPITDWPLYLLCAQVGDLMFVDDTVGLYRLHGGGEMSGKAELERLRFIARFYQHMMNANSGRWSSCAQRGGSLYFAGKASQFLSQSKPTEARTALALALRAGGVGISVRWRDWLGLLRRSF